MLQPQKRTRYGCEIQMPLVSIDNIPEICLSDMNPSFYRYRETYEEDELSDEVYQKRIQELLGSNPNLWTSLYTHDIIDSSMIPQAFLDGETDVPF